MHEVSTTDEAGVLKGACVDFTGSIPAGFHSLHVPAAVSKQESKQHHLFRQLGVAYSFAYYIILYYIILYYIILYYIILYIHIVYI